MTLDLVTKLIPWLGIAGLIFSFGAYFNMKRYPAGDELMQKIADKIHAGAFVFLKREYQIIFIFILIVFAALTFTPGLGINTAVAFLVGALCSMGAGVLGMEAATRAAVRATQGAKDGGIGRALTIAFGGGSVMGMAVAALGVVGLGFYFLFTKDPRIINGFAMGASSIALFAASFPTSSISMSLMRLLPA